jgi:hypothetical protein
VLEFAVWRLRDALAPHGLQVGRAVPAHEVRREHRIGEQLVRRNEDIAKKQRVDLGGVAQREELGPVAAERRSEHAGAVDLQRDHQAGESIGEDFRARLGRIADRHDTHRPAQRCDLLEEHLAGADRSGKHDQDRPVAASVDVRPVYPGNANGPNRGIEMPRLSA